MTPFVPGIDPSLSMEQYHSIDALNAHGLYELDRSPAHYRHRREHPSESTAAQGLGSYLHALILGGSEAFAVAPVCDRRTSEGKAAWERFLLAADNRAVVKSDDAATAVQMASALRANPAAVAALSGAREQCLFWTEGEVPCKARPDCITDVRQRDRWVVDLKSCRDAEHDAFARDAARYRYHWQMAWYCRGARACGLPVTRALIVAVESPAPFGVAVYELDTAALEAGDYHCRRLLEVYRECRTAAEWPCYPAEIQPLRLPMYATDLPDGLVWEGDEE